MVRIARRSGDPEANTNEHACSFCRRLRIRRAREAKGGGVVQSGGRFLPQRSPAAPATRAARMATAKMTFIVSEKSIGGAVLRG